MVSLAAVAALDDVNENNGKEHIRLLKGAVAELLTKLEEVNGRVEYFKKKDEDRKKNVVESHAFKVIGYYSGKENELKNFETRLQALVRHHVGFERFLDIIKTYDSISTKSEMESIQDTLTDAFEDSNEKPNVEWMNEQLYQVLCLVCQNSALLAVQNLRMKYEYRGAAAWHSIVREAGGRSDAKRAALGKRTHEPKKAKTAFDIDECIKLWEGDLEELEREDKIVLPDMTRKLTLIGMMPAHIQKDIEDHAAKEEYAGVYKHIYGKLNTYKKNEGEAKGKKKDADAMDVDALNAGEADEGEEEGCKGCDDGELHAWEKGKGKGKSQFQGYCNFCGAWGHRKSECNKFTDELRRKGRERKGVRGEG